MTRDIQAFAKQAVVNDEKLSHRCGGSTRVRSHDEKRSCKWQPAKQRGDGFRIHVVEYVQSWISVSRSLVEHVPSTRSERGPKRDRTQRRPTDAEDDDIVVFTAGRCGIACNLLEQRLVFGESDEAHRTGPTELFEAADGGGERVTAGSRRQHGLIDAARRAQTGG